MAAKLRRYIDASTRDYVILAGGFKGDDGIASKIVLALGMRRGSCPVFPGFGSRLHLVKKADERGRLEAEAYGKEALVHLTEAKELAVTAAISTVRPGTITLEVSYRLGTETKRVPYTARVGAAA